MCHQFHFNSVPLPCTIYSPPFLHNTNRKGQKKSSFMALYAVVQSWLEQNGLMCQFPSGGGVLLLKILYKRASFVPFVERLVRFVNAIAIVPRFRFLVRRWKTPYYFVNWPSLTPRLTDCYEIENNNAPFCSERS